MALNGDRLTDRIVIGILCATIIWYAYLIFGFGTRFPGDLGDARFNQFILEHVTRWLSGAESDLSTPPFFYPFRNTLYFSDTHFGSAIIYALARWGGASREMAFNIWFAFGQLISFTTCIIVLRRRNIPLRESMLGAFIFSFSLPVLAQNEHAQLIYRFAIPFAVDAFIKWTDRRDTHDGINFLIWTIVQMIFSLYLGLFLIILFAMLTLTMKLFFTNRTTQEIIGMDAEHSSPPILFKMLILLIGAMVLGYELLQYLQIALTFGLRREWSEIAPMLPHLESYLIADRSPLWRWISQSIQDIPQRQEHQLFPGIPTLVLLIGALFIPDENKSVRCIKQILFVALIFSVIATLNIGDVSIYRIFTLAAGFNALRAITRIYLVLLFPIAFLAAYALLNFRHYRPLLSNFASIVISLLLSIETTTFHYATTDIQIARDRIDVMDKSISAAKPSVGSFGILTLADPDKITWLSTIDAMLVAQYRHLTLFSGYSGNFPTNYKSMQDCDDVKTYLSQIRSAHLPEKFIDREVPQPLAVLVLPANACSAIHYQ